jgi:hypothetical protein
MKRTTFLTFALILCMVAVALAASLGPNSPATLVDDTTVGTRAWTNPTNAVSSNNTYATVAGDGSGDTLQSHYLKATNFGFSIPGGATISGIVVEVEAKDDGLATNKINLVRLVKGGAIQPQSQAADSPAALTTTDTYKVYGSSSQLWGQTWTDADINASTFGVVVAAQLDFLGSGVVSTASIDHIRITIYYSVAGGSVTSAHVMLMGSGER